MGLLGSVFGVLGGIAGEVVKESTGVDISKGINTIKEGRLEEAIYEMRDDMEGTAYSKFRQRLRSLSDEDFERINTDTLIEVQMKAYEDEKKRRRL